MPLFTNENRFDYGQVYEVKKEIQFDDVLGSGQVVSTLLQPGAKIRVVGMAPGATPGHGTIEVELPKKDHKTVLQTAFDKFVTEGVLVEDIEDIPLTGKTLPMRTTQQTNAYKELQRLASQCHPDDVREFCEQHIKD